MNIMDVEVIQEDESRFTVVFSGKTLEELQEQAEKVSEWTDGRRGAEFVVEYLLYEAIELPDPFQDLLDCL